ncbi:hypothetical protein M404DRAFT_1001329 [Pisolithus tinctorius Marx 270]|uniref:Secreted protein n=1 Tax=Pisolithus tinctorius Marx 270 TaxID=870435 RepID=A0A0C3NRD5_PISTI|nr:hypothetical protein M404DRAFT_1001329 [Pisolithus tinctorius Marx 270]
MTQIILSFVLSQATCSVPSSAIPEHGATEPILNPRSNDARTHNLYHGHGLSVKLSRTIWLHPI